MIYKYWIKQYDLNLLSLNDRDLHSAFLPVLLITITAFVKLLKSLGFFSKSSGELVFCRRYWGITYPDTWPNYTLSWDFAELNDIQTYSRNKPFLYFFTEVGFHVTLGQNSIQRRQSRPQTWSILRTGVV